MPSKAALKQFKLEEEVKGFVDKLDISKENSVKYESGNDETFKKGRRQNKYRPKGANKSKTSFSAENVKHKKFNASKPNDMKNNDDCSKPLNIMLIPSRIHVIVKPGSKWYESKITSDEVNPNKVSLRLSELQKTGEALHEADITAYKSKQEKGRKNAEMNWIKTAVSSGTLVDKISALTLLIQNSPVHNVSSLESMIKVVQTKKKRECLMSIDSLKELFLSDLLIPDKKLKNFNENPVDSVEVLCSRNIESIHRQLLLWHFEDKLKKCFQNFVVALEVLTHDSVEATKHKALAAIHELLASNPEQEQYLLAKLVNKLGDPSHRTAAQTSRLLGLLIHKHPDMTNVVVQEVERLLYRPNIALKAQYYGICFLNQILFSKEENELAARLINIYFGFFKLCHTKGEVDSKMMNALLTGVNRAYPFVTNELKSIDEQLDTMYKIVHTVNINISVQALMLLFQVMDSRNLISDRYYTALYRKLLDPQLKICSRQAMLLNLLFKSLKKDHSETRVKAFLNRMLQVALHFPPHLTCGILFLISELMKTKPGILDSVSSGAFRDQVDKFGDDKDDDDVEASEKNASSWIHRSNANRSNKGNEYNPLERNPMYSGAEWSCMWALKSLVNHYHPSVGLFAQGLLDRKAIDYDGDPLHDFTLIRFLDRFVFRNPKKLIHSQQNEMKSRSVFCKRLLKELPSAKRIAVDSDDYVKQPADAIPADERFLYNYFNQRVRDTLKIGSKDSDGDSITSEQFGKFLDAIEPGSKPSQLDIDFASEFSSARSSKKGKRRSVDESDSDILDVDDDELKKAFKDFDDLAEGGNRVEFDEEDIAFESGDDELNSDMKRKSSDDVVDDDEMLPIVKKKKYSKYDTASLFANAEEFADMMDNAGSTVDMSGTEAMSNKDNADVKQLKWEVQRDKQIRGQDWKQRKGRRKQSQMKKSNFRRKNGNVPRGKKTA